jgi:hypothetical protein
LSANIGKFPDIFGLPRLVSERAVVFQPEGGARCGVFWRGNPRVHERHAAFSGREDAFGAFGRPAPRSSLPYLKMSVQRLRDDAKKAAEDGRL